MHFLKMIDFKGYAKWVVLNQAVKEEPVRLPPEIKEEVPGIAS